jgi:hypothetical protein
MAAALAITRSNSCSLYEIEDTLLAMVNTVDLVEDSSDRQLILEEIGQALCRTKEKRDAIVAFLRHCELQLKFADAEIERIQKRKAFIARVQEELERYVVQVIDQFAVPDRRGIKRFEGNVSSMRIQKNPDSVLITDLDAVPLALKEVVLTLPAYVWEAWLQRVSVEERKTFEGCVERAEFKPDKKAIGAELKKGTQVPGADLKFGEWRLVVS